MKKCFKCGIAKPLSEFYKHSRMADGHLNKCKQCTKTDVFNHRHGENRDSVLACDRARAGLPHRKELRKKTVSNWVKLYPERRRASTMVNAAIRAGRLFRWPTCALPDCDKTPEAHHPDYEQPLQVVWLCSAHHKQAHALVRKP